MKELKVVPCELYGGFTYKWLNAEQIQDEENETKSNTSTNQSSATVLMNGKMSKKTSHIYKIANSERKFRFDVAKFY